MSVLLLELGYLGRDHELAVPLAGIAGKVFLMIFLGWVEGFERYELGDNGVVKELFCSQFSDDFFSFRFLRFVGVEDGRTVLGTDIRALAVERGWVVDGEKDVQKVRKGDDGRVEGDLHGLGMTRGAAADLFVSGVWAFAARVA